MSLRRLIDAVCADDLEQVRGILKARPELVNMETAENDEHRPLHYAVLNRLPAMVRVLMEHGADARKGIYPHRDATAALTIATERGYDDIAAIILEQEQKRLPNRAVDDDDVSNSDEESAVERGDVEWLRVRHAEGALVNRIEWSSGGLLTLAVRHNRTATLAMLLECGFDCNERVRSPELEENVYSQGFPLWQCAALGRYEMAEMLLQEGADPNVHVYASGSPVYSAFSHRQWPMVDLLKRYGGLVTADIAGVYRETEVANALLTNSARELLEHAASGGAPEIVRMALPHIDWAADDPRWFHILSSPLSFWHHIPWLYAGNKEFDRGTYIECFKLILSRCGPNLIGRFNRTMMHEVAALRDYVTEEEGARFASELLNLGARLDIRDNLLKSTPLGWACRWGRIEVVKLLLEHGADPVELDAEPWATPLAWAAKMGHDDVTALLEDHLTGSR